MKVVRRREAKSVGKQTSPSACSRSLSWADRPVTRPMIQTSRKHSADEVRGRSEESQLNGFAALIQQTQREQRRDSRGMETKGWSSTSCSASALKELGCFRPLWGPYSRKRVIARKTHVRAGGGVGGPTSSKTDRCIIVVERSKSGSPGTLALDRSRRSSAEWKTQEAGS